MRAVALGWIALLLTVSLSAIEPAAPPANVYIDSMGGFGAYLAAAFQAKAVPLVVVTDRRYADFEISGSSLRKDPHWAEDLVLSQGGAFQSATVSMVNLKTSQMVFACAYSKSYALHGEKSAAESCAKRLRAAMDKGSVDLRSATVRAGHHAGETTSVPSGEADPQAAIPPARQLLPVAIASDPAGARIEVERIFAGVTPLTIKLQPGEYSVTLNLAGHETWHGKIIVETGAPAAIAAALRPLVTAAAAKLR